MMHHRINEKQSNSNPHINFITALPASDDTEQAAAIQLLRALAAQVRPIMKSHGFIVNSLEEVCNLSRLLNSYQLTRSSMNTIMSLLGETGMQVKQLVRWSHFTFIRRC